MKSLNNEQRKLVEENHNLIYGFMQKHNCEYDIASIGLCKAGISFDSTKGYNFSTYAYKIMLNEFYNTYNRDKNNKFEFADYDTDYANYLEQGYDEIEKIDICKYCKNETEKQIVKLKYIGYNGREISEMLEMTNSAINQKLRQIRSRIK